MIFNMEGRAAKERKKERKYDGGGTTDADVFLFSSFHDTEREQVRDDMRMLLVDI